LRSDRVSIDLIDDPDDALRRLRAGREFLEGTDIASEEFEDWLRQERASPNDRAERFGPEPVAPDGAKPDRLSDTGPVSAAEPGPVVGDVPILYFDTASLTSPDKVELFLTDAISAQLTWTATSHFRADVRALDGTLQPTIVAPDARFVIRVTAINGEYIALARMTEEPIGRFFWSRQVLIDGQDNQAIIDAAASLATEASEAMAARQIMASPAQKDRGSSGLAEASEESAPLTAVYPAGYNRMHEDEVEAEHRCLRGNPPASGRNGL
tara:strand:+ start:3425 stop:4228 length:804 start_codon:yes stop_codon:yes gene_type:complete